MSNIVVSNMGERPAFLSNAKPEGLEGLGNFILLPFMKIVQKQAKQEILDFCDVGSIIDGTSKQFFRKPVYKPGSKQIDFDAMSPLYVTPLFFFYDFVVLNALGMKPVVLERSNNPDSEIAKIARSGNNKRPHPPNPSEEVSYIENLNFIVVVHNPDDEGLKTEAIMSMSRTNFFAGRNFASLIMARNADIFSGVYSLSLTHSRNEKGDWFKYNVANNGWIENLEVYEKLRERSRFFRENHARIKIAEDDEISEVVGDTVNAQDKDKF